MAKNPDRVERSAPWRPSRAALTTLAQAVTAFVACGLWLGLAAPGLKLLPGLGSLGDRTIAISLQSAVLGLDDGTGRSSTAAVKAAALALGLTDANEPLAGTQAPRKGAKGAPTDASASVVVRLAGGALSAVVTSSARRKSAPPRTRTAAVPSRQPAPPPAKRPPTTTARAAVPPTTAAPSGHPSPTPTKPPPPPPSAPPPVASDGPTSSLSEQTIYFTSTAPVGAVVGAPAYQVAAAATSGLAVSFAAPASSAGVCTVSMSIVYFVGPGTCAIDASQPGNRVYNPAPSVRQSFRVDRTVQAISFSSTLPGSATVGGSAYTVTATASSGLSVAFAAAPGSVGVCTVSGSTVTFVGAGTCTINADQAGSGGFQPAPRAQQSFTVSRGAQAITFTSTPPKVDKKDPPYTVTAAATSGLAVVFTLAAESANVCSVSGSTVSFFARGDCLIYANQPGNQNWLAAPQVQQLIHVKNHTPG